MDQDMVRDVSCMLKLLYVTSRSAMFWIYY